MLGLSAPRPGRYRLEFSDTITGNVGEVRELEIEGEIIITLPAVTRDLAVTTTNPGSGPPGLPSRGDQRRAHGCDRCSDPREHHDLAGHQARYRDHDGDDGDASGDHGNADV